MFAMRFLILIGLVRLQSSSVKPVVCAVAYGTSVALLRLAGGATLEDAAFGGSS